MRAHLVRADELHPGDVVIGTDQDGPYEGGPREVAGATTHPAHGDHPATVHLAWTTGTDTDVYDHRTAMLVDRRR
jgi:hypothetical protein